MWKGRASRSKQARGGQRRFGDAGFRRGRLTGLRQLSPFRLRTHPKFHDIRCQHENSLNPSVSACDFQEKRFISVYLHHWRSDLFPFYTTPLQTPPGQAKPFPSSQEDTTIKMADGLLNQLLDMGFEKERAELAIRKAPNCKLVVA